MYSLYFQAQVNKKETWFLAATLRSFEHLAFDRTVDKQAGIFEFFCNAASRRAICAAYELLFRARYYYVVQKDAKSAQV